jgi:hypothetical protein
LGRESVCARAAVTASSRGVGINVIAAIPDASGNCGGGRPPSVSRSDELGRKSAGSMPLLSAVGGHAAVRLLCPAREPIVATAVARGHAAEKISVIFAIVPAATNHAARRLVLRLGIAETAVDKTSAAYSIVNVSGCAATLRRDDSNAAWNTKRKDLGVAAGVAIGRGLSMFACSTAPMRSSTIGSTKQAE